MIRYATIDDLNTLIKWDHHIARKELELSIQNKRVLVFYEDHHFVGWLRYNLFWDNTPFMNLLFILSPHQNKGYGTQLVQFWEKEMKQQGYSLVLTSTLSTETAQHFYRKLGYKDCGSLLLPNEPNELILLKDFTL